MRSSDSPPRIAHPPAQPLVLFDGDCGFCRFWIERWKAQSSERIRFEPYQSAASRYPEIPKERFAEAMQMIDTDGTVYEGADAVFRTLRGSRWHWLEKLADTM